MKRTKRQAFTVVELLIVMAIVSILAMMLLPVLNNVRASARKISCLGRVKQVGIAMQMYAGDFAWFPYRSYPTNNDEWASATNENRQHMVFTDRIYPVYVGDYHIFYCPAFVWKQPRKSVKPPGYPWSYKNNWWSDGTQINYWYYGVYGNRSQHWKESHLQSDKPPHSHTASRYPTAIIYYEAGDNFAQSTPIMVSHPIGAQSAMKRYNPVAGHHAAVLCYDASGHFVRVPFGEDALAPQGYWLLQDAPK